MSQSFFFCEVVDGISDLLREVEHKHSKRSADELLALNRTAFAIRLQALLAEYGISDSVLWDPVWQIMTGVKPKSNFALRWHMDPLNDDLEGACNHPVVGGAFHVLVYTQVEQQGGQLQIALDRQNVPFDQLRPNEPDVKSCITFDVCRDMVVVFSEDQLHRVLPLTGKGTRVSVNISCMSPSIRTATVFNYCVHSVSD